MSEKIYNSNLTRNQSVYTIGITKRNQWAMRGQSKFQKKKEKG